MLTGKISKSKTYVYFCIARDTTRSPQSGALYRRSFIYQPVIEHRRQLALIRDNLVATINQIHMIKRMHTSTPSIQRPISTLAILVLALLSAVAPLATDMYLPGFPSIAEELGAEASQVQLTLTSFLLGLALGQLLIGPLSDRYGRRRPLLLGTSVALLAGAASVFAPDVHTLIGLRFLQGLGGAAGIVIARAVIADRSQDPRASARLFQIMMMIGGLAPVLAPIIGTGIVSVSDWRGVFVALTLLSMLSLLGVYKVIEESLPPAKRTASGLAAQWTATRSVLSNRRYLGLILTTSLTFVVLFGYISASPFVLQDILGLSPFAYSIAFGTNAAGIIVSSAISAKLLDRYSPRRLASVGLASLLGGSLLVLFAVQTQAGAALLLPALFVTVASLGLIMGNASALALAETPRSTGTASALMGAMQFTLGALASPLVGLAGQHSALPMALVMVAAAVLAIICFTTLARSEAALSEASAVSP